MSPLEARKIIDALANGIDPETGEILPEQSTFNNPQVIRALFVAAKALDNAERRAERDNSLPGNAGRPWSDLEDQQLLALFDAKDTGGDVVLVPASDLDMRGKNAVVKPSLEVVYDDV